MDTKNITTQKAASYTPFITFLNMTGDVTITWDKSNEAQILTMIEQKMKEGYSFFILKPRFFCLFGKKKVRATSMQQVAAAGSVVIDDDQASHMMRNTASRPKVDDPAVEDLLAQRKAYLAPQAHDNAGSMDTVRRARSAQEVLQGQTIAVRRVVGG